MEESPKTPQIGHIIFKLLIDRGYTVKSFSTEKNFPYATLLRVTSGQQLPSAKHLFQLSQMLDVELSVFFTSTDALDPKDKEKVKVLRKEKRKTRKYTKGSRKQFGALLNESLIGEIDKLATKLGISKALLVENLITTAMVKCKDQLIEFDESLFLKGE